MFAQASRNERGVGQTSGVQREGEGTDLRMLVHQSQAGCIIGKGGLKVKELRDVSVMGQARYEPGRPPFLRYFVLGVGVWGSVRARPPCSEASEASEARPAAGSRLVERGGRLWLAGAARRAEPAE